MVQRTFKMIGEAYSTGGDVQVIATYNGVEIINGTVATTVVDVVPVVEELPNFPELELCQFESTTEATGMIPVTISVTGGTLFFRHFWMNYIGFRGVRQATDSNVPIDKNDLSTWTWLMTVPPRLHFASYPKTPESDDILNLTKNGEPWPWRVNADSESVGEWIYPINHGETVTFDFFVDPAKVLTTVWNTGPGSVDY